MRIQAIQVPHRSLYTRLETANRQYGPRPISNANGAIHPLGFVYDRLYFLYHERKMRVPSILPTNIFNVFSVVMDQPNSWSTLFDKSIIYRSEFTYNPCIGLSSGTIMVLYGDVDILRLIRINRNNNQRTNYQSTIIDDQLQFQYIRLACNNNEWFAVSFRVIPSECKEKSDCCLWRLNLNESNSTFSMEYVLAPNSPLCSFFSRESSEDFIHSHLELFFYNNNLIIGQRVMKEARFDVILYNHYEGLMIYKLADLLPFSKFRHDSQRLTPVCLQFFNGHLVLLTAERRRETNGAAMRVSIFKVHLDRHTKTYSVTPWFAIPKIFFVVDAGLRFALAASSCFDYIVMFPAAFTMRIDHTTPFRVGFIATGPANQREPPTLLQLCKRVVYGSHYEYFKMSYQNVISLFSDAGI